MAMIDGVESWEKLAEASGLKMSYKARVVDPMKVLLVGLMYLAKDSH